MPSVLLRTRPCCVVKHFFFFLNPLTTHNNRVHIKRIESMLSTNSKAQVVTEGRPFRHRKHKEKRFLEDSNQNANHRDGRGRWRETGGTGRKGAHCIYSLWPFLPPDGQNVPSDTTLRESFVSQEPHSHVTSDHFSIRNEKRRRAAASVQRDALLYVSYISKQPGQICHFQLRGAVRCRGSKCSLLCFRGNSIQHHSCRSFDNREYSQHSRLYCAR